MVPELLCEKWQLEYKDLKIFFFPALMKFPFTRKIWEIFLSEAKSVVKVLFISESLENRLPVVNFICRRVITGWVKAFFFLFSAVPDGFSTFLFTFAFSDAPAPFATKKDPGAIC